jgi:hypothetical protein
MRTRSTIIVTAIATASILHLPAAAAVETPEFAEAVSAHRLAPREQAEHRQAEFLAELRLLNGPYEEYEGEFIWAIERWRPLVANYFPEDRIDWALRIMECESHGDPLAKNPTSTASGLFQHLANLWEERAADAGWAGTDVFDPIANIAVAAWLLETGGPGHWVCQASR